jgi:PAS domain S-box-containing protein
MKRTAYRWKLTFIIIGAIGFILTVEAVILAVVLSLDNSEAGLGLLEILLLHAGVVGACLLGFSIWSYWIAGKTVAKLLECIARIRSLGMSFNSDDALPLKQGYLWGRTPVDMLMNLVEQQTIRHLQTHQELKRANGFLQSMIRHNTVAIYIISLEGRVMMVNPAFEELFGYSREELQDSLDPIVPERLKGEASQLIEQVRSGIPVNGYETKRRTSDGREIHISLTLSPVLNDNGELAALAAISRNITDRKTTEEKLLRSEKLSVVGQLAAGVAHEIRNPLTTLRGFVQLLRQRNTAANPEHLELMLKELDRINFIVSEFIVLSKPHLNQYMFKDLTCLLHDLARLLEPQANLGGIVLDTRLEPELPMIRCEENQLKQVFLNVIKNGMEAMPDGGVVTMEACRVDSGRVLVRISDSGVGIPEDLLAKLGEPFVTNKVEGTGLGVMISQRIIANHKGQMSIRSELGKGTSVDIMLPIDFEHVKLEVLPYICPIEKAEKPA